MQNGIKLIEETISYLESMFTIQDNKYVFGVLNFSSLKNGFEVEFYNWLKTVDEDVEALIERLRELSSLNTDKQ